MNSIAASSEAAANVTHAPGDQNFHCGIFHIRLHRGEAILVPACKQE
jgi:hypothetical protein